MNRTRGRRLITAVLAPAVLLLASCAAEPDGTLAVTGSVDATVVTVSVPSLGAPHPDLDAGFTVRTSDSGASPTGPSAASAQPAPQRVADVAVRVGDHVAAGDVLIRLDAGSLQAAVTAAERARTTASAQVTVLRVSRDDIDDTATSLATAGRKIDTAISMLTAQRAQVAAHLLAAQRQLAALPTNPPAAAAHQVEQARSRLQAAGAELASALVKMDAGLAQARAQRAQVTTATQKAATARTQLTHLIDLAVVAVDAAGVTVRQAELAVSTATVVAPSAGTVTSIASPGQVLAAGATLATLTGPQTTLTTWLPPAEAATLCTGDAARVTADWLVGDVRGKVDVIGTSVEYPPTEQASADVHLTRAVRVTVRVTGTQGLPPGGPADISLTGCKAER